MRPGGQLNAQQVATQTKLGYEAAKKKLQQSKAASVEDEDKSELVKAIEARERPTREFDLGDVLGLGGKPVGLTLFRYVTRTETDRAIKGALDYVAQLAANNELIKSEQDIIIDAKNAYVLFEAVRRHDRPMLPAFASPKWMLDNLTSEQIAVMIHYYQLMVAEQGIIKEELSDEDIEQTIEGVALTSDSDLPNLAFAALPRDSLCQYAVRVTLMLNSERATVDMLRKELDVFRKGLAEEEPPDESISQDGGPEQGDSGPEQDKPVT